MLIVLLTILLAGFDFRARRVPNWVTLPLLASGLIAHFPGAPETWLGCLLLGLAWRAGWLGGGDVKLWLALLWLVPVSLASAALPALGAAFVLTALFQLLWRRAIGRKNLTGFRAPAAWRAVPFALWLWLQTSALV